MKKIVMVSMLSFILAVALGTIVTQAGAETMHFKLVSMVNKMERVTVTHLDLK